MAESIYEPVNQSFWRQSAVRPMRLMFGRADRVRIAMMFASLFAFFGVMGKLLFVPGMRTFRTYYFVLPIGLLVLTLLGTKSTWKLLLTCAPLAIYIILSAATANLDAATQSRTTMGKQVYSVGASSPIPAALMLVTQALFVIVAASHVKKVSNDAKVHLIEMYLSGYLVTLCVGYIFLVGRKMGVLSNAFIHMFQLVRNLDDKRFSPGSDPNEYGIMSSAALTLMLVYLFSSMGRDDPRTWFARLFGNPWFAVPSVLLTFIALLFTSTRSAILGLAGGIVWILLRTVGPRIRRIRVPRNWVLYSFCGIFACAAVFVALAVYDAEHLGFLYKKFADASRLKGSTADDRITLLREAFNHMASHPLLGYGYHTHEYIHNTYLQGICDLGVIGTALLIATGAVVFAQFRDGGVLAERDATTSSQAQFLIYAKEILLWNVLWFSATNHNFDQFLAWFTVLITLAVVPSGRRELRFQRWGEATYPCTT